MMQLLKTMMSRGQSPGTAVATDDSEAAIVAKPLPSHSTGPLLAMAGVSSFTFKWPSHNDIITIGLALVKDANFDAPTPTPAVWAMLLERLCDLPPATSRRLALAYPDAVAVMFAHAFKQMRATLPDGDPRLGERLPAILGGAV